MVRLFKQIATITLLSASLTSLLTGCASVKVASQQEDAKAKTFATNPNQANLYIYRNEFMGASIRMPVELDGREIGKTGPKSYLSLGVSPGKHTLVSKAENDFTLELSTEAGKNYYVWQEVKMGLLYARSKLQLMDEAQGQAGVKESQLLETQDNIGTKTSITATPVTSNSAPASASASPPTNTSTNTPVNAPVSKPSPELAAANPILNTASSTMKIERVPFELGVSSVTVERIAKQNSCHSKKGAGLLYKKGPVEVYRVECEDGREIKARCEIRQCELFKP